MDDFNQRLEAEAEKYASMDREVVDYTGAEIDAFQAGAHWSREETIKEITAWLRGEDADFEAKYGVMNSPRAAADRIEMMLLGPKDSQK